MTNHTISANTLFHFTKSIDNLKNILTHTFSPRYCLEHIDDSLVNLSIAIPMVCFCDIPLSQIKDHVDTYGNYAIGLSKEWAMSKGISPVLYLHKNSVTNEMMQQFLATSKDLDNIENPDSDKAINKRTRDFFQLYFFCKSYKGDMRRNGEIKRDITFYNENEWRYVPSLSELEEMKASLFLHKTTFEDESLRNENNEKNESIKIKFSPNDIRYIIVMKESERYEMIWMIEQIKGDIFKPNELKILNSKIISVEQIKEDF